MAWSGNFDDFNEFSTDYNEKPSRPSYPSGSTVPAALMKISDIHTQTESVSIIGVALAKEGPKSILSKKGTERYLLALTVRDSPDYMINVTCWGKEEFVNGIAASIQIGDVVQVLSAQVQPKSSQQNEARYKPWTPSEFQLNVSENAGSVVPYSDPQAAHYTQLLHIPVKATNDFYTLDDINTNGMDLVGKHVNLLVAVKKVGPVKSFKTKAGKPTQKCEVIVFDETCDSFTLDLWGGNSNVSRSWMPFSTVLFATDVKISHNDYKGSMIATADTKTIFITNPGTPEAQSLFEFAYNTGDVEEAAAFEAEYVNDPQNIDFTNMKTSTMEEIIHLKQEMIEKNCSSVQYAKCLAFLTTLDITPDDGNIFSTICAQCHKEVRDGENFRCGNPACSMSSSLEPPQVYLEYRLFVALSDHTGTFQRCYLARPEAEKMLGCKAGEFIGLDDDRKTQLKWNHLLEKKTFHIKLQKVPADSTGRPCLTVVATAPVGT